MSNTKKTVLIPIDLADETLPRLKQSYPNLKYLADNVILLYVFNKNVLFSSEEERTAEIFKRESQLKEIANDIQLKTGLDVKHVFQSGKPSEEILNAATSYDVSMIAISTHTSINEKHTHNNPIGSTVNRIIRASKVPVFSFNGNVKLQKIKKILLPLDLTVETKQKVTNAIQLAKKLGASIAIVSVFYSLKHDDIKEQLEEQLKQVKEFINEDNIHCTVGLVEEKGGARMVSHAILDYAEKENANLIMIMTQQENKLVEFFMGSSAQTMIRYSKIPIVSILPKELGFVVGV